jgi:uncharacterized protein (TIGR01777 family)
MRIVLTGATGYVGTKLVAALRERGDEITVLSRDGARASEQLGVDAADWDWTAGPAAAAALTGCDVVVHLAGEPVAQRWNDAVKRRINDSRELGTRALVDGLRDAQPRPRRLVCASASAFYGAGGDELVDETSPPGRDWLADVCVRWEREARVASELGMSVVTLRTGITVDPEYGALASMMLPFKLGLGGPLAGGRQYVPWIHPDDLVGLYLRAIDAPDFDGPINACAPAPVTNRQLSRTLGRALHRPAIVPVPGLVAKLMVGDVAKYAISGVRMVPARAAELGYRFAFPEIDGALADALH